MSDIRAILALEPAPFEWRGQQLLVKRPSLTDLIDATQSAEHAGKATGKDEAAGKLTYPGVHGIDASRREVERLRHAAHGALSAAGLASGSLGTLVEYLAARTR